MALMDLVLPRRVVAVSLNGFLFFGNSVSNTDSIEEVGTTCAFSTRVSCVTLRVFCIISGVAVSLNGFVFFGNTVSFTDSIDEVGTAS